MPLLLGGNHVTMDLARGLGTRVEDAEFIKVKHGSVLLGAGDDAAMVDHSADFRRWCRCAVTCQPGADW